MEDSPGIYLKPGPELIARARDILAKALQRDLKPPADAVDLNEARDLGVIGPAKEVPPISAEAPPPEPLGVSAQRAIPASAKDLTEKITKTPAGEPIDAWTARFKDWVRRLKSPEEIKPFIEQAAAENDNFQQARAGEVPASHVEIVAEAAGMDPTQVDVGGLSTKFNTPTKIRILKQTLDTVTEDFREASGKYDADDSPENLKGMLEARIRRDMVLEYTMGLRAEWAYTGHALREILNPRAVAAEAAAEAKPAVPGQPAKPKPEPKPELPKAAKDLGDAATRIADKLQKKREGKGEGKLGIENLINAAIDLVDEAKPAEVKEPGEPKAPMDPYVKELVKTAQAVVNLMDIREPAQPGVPTVRPLRQLIKESDKAPQSPLAKFNKLVSDAERFASNMAKEARTSNSGEALPPELADLVEAAKNVSEHFGGAGLERAVQELLQKAGKTVDEMKDMARSMRGLTTAQAARVLTNMRSDAQSPWHWAWTNGLISGPLTHTKYFGANALMLMVEHGITTPGATILGLVKKAFGSTADRVFFGEAVAGMAGLVEAVPEAFMATYKAIRQGQRSILKSELELYRRMVARGERIPAELVRTVNQITGQRPTEPLRIGRKGYEGTLEIPLDGVWGRIFGVPGDAANGIHTFFKVLGERAGINSRSYRKAITDVPEAWTSGDKEKDFWDRFQYHRLNPTDETLIGARADGYKGTFMAEAGPVGKDWQRFVKHSRLAPVLKWAFPFNHIPGQLIKRTYEHSFLAPLDKEMQAEIKGERGGIKQDRAIVRMVAGSALMGWFANEYLQNRATGDYPWDPTERDSWNLLNKQPNSLLMNGYWVSFSKLGPIGSLVNLAVNLASIVPYLRKEDDEQMTRATTQLAVSAARMIIDEVGFMSIAMLFEGLQDGKKLPAFIANQAASFMPYSSFFRQMASGGVPGLGWGGDPYQREAKTFIDGIKYGIPFLRRTLEPKRDFLGTPLANPQYGNIIRQKPAATDAVALEMDRLGIHPAPPDRVVSGVTLPAHLYGQYQAMAGIYVRRNLEMLMAQPNWNRMPLFGQQEAFHGAIRAGHSAAQAHIIADYRAIIRQGTENKRQQILGNKVTPSMKKFPEPAEAP